MALSHCRTRTRTRTGIRIRRVFPLATVVTCQMFTLHGSGLGLGFGSLSRMATVPILGTDICPWGLKSESESHCSHWDWDPSPNVCENLHSTRIRVRVRVRVRVRQCERAIICCVTQPHKSTLWFLHENYTFF